MALNKVVSAKGFPEFKKLTDADAVPGINMIIFGPPGVGKTTLAVGAQGTELGGNTVLVDVDHGRESVLDVQGVEFFVPESWAELRGVVDTAMALGADSPYKTWVFDSLTTIYHKLILPKVTGSQTSQVQLQHYGEAQRLLLKLIRDCVDLCEAGINTVFLGHVREEKTSGDILEIFLNLPEKVRDLAIAEVNHVGYYTRDRKEISKRLLHFEPPRRVNGPKIRQTRTGFNMSLEIENPSMGNIFNELRKKDK